MNETTRNIILVVTLAAVGYFIWKETQTSTTTATTAGTSPVNPQGTNLSAPVTGLLNTKTGFLSGQVLPTTVATGLDLLHSVFQGDGVGTGGSLDSSGGNGDDEGAMEDDEG